MVPHIGQTVHRIVVYAVFICVLLIFIIGSVKTARLYRERFTVILTTMIAIGIWQTFYIFSRTPVDRSMIGYGVFGILVFYFALYYRPMRLLDRMLSNIVSDMGCRLFQGYYFAKPMPVEEFEKLAFDTALPVGQGAKTQ